MNNELITLVTVLETPQDDSGFKIGENVEKTEIFASTKSVGRAEFYEAMRNGYKASIIFEVDSEDFKLADREIQVEDEIKKIKAIKIIHENVTYRIIRTYQKDSGMLEVTCEEVE